jgi:serine/threonine-protein kinase
MRLSKPNTSSQITGGNDAGDADAADVAVAANVAEESTRAPKKSINRKFGRYELLMEMGTGGMASLYLARLRGPENFEKLLAIKRIHENLAQEEDFIKMFLDEARIAALIHHPNVATTFDMGRIEGSHFIAMEYVHGHNLGELIRESIRQKRPLSWEYGARIIANAAKGLHAAHQLTNSDGAPLNVVHRDVSPQNLLISYDGHVKVVDFGIAYAAERLVHTSTGTMKGKAAYMSPEQIDARPVDRRSDVFALGIVLFEAVCMRRLFKADSDAATMMRVVKGQVPKPRTVRAEIPLELERIILKSLAVDPTERFVTAGDMADALEELLVGHGKVVSENKIGQLMVRLFEHKKRVKDREINQALHEENDVVHEAVAVGVTSGTSLQAPAGLSQRTRRPQKSKHTALLIAGFFGFATVVLLVLWLSGLLDRNNDAPAKNTGAAAAKPTADAEPRTAPRTRPAAPRPAKVMIRVEVRPKSANALIKLAGKRYRGSTIETLLPRAETPLRLRVNAPGFHPENMMFVPTKDRTIPVKLTPRKQRQRPRPERRPTRRRTRPTRRRTTRRNVPRLKGLGD